MSGLATLSNSWKWIIHRWILSLVALAVARGRIVGEWILQTRDGRQYPVLVWS